MKFIYDEVIDNKCQNELAAHKTIFGQEKNNEIFSVDDKIIKKFNDVFTPKIEEEIATGMFKIFGVYLPKDLKYYINSTPYSMDIEEGVSISASTQTPIRATCHEVNHYMFRKSKYKELYFNEVDMEEAKEIFTIVNNLYFQNIIENQDVGWKKFWKQRYQFLNIWIKDRS